LEFFNEKKACVLWIYCDYRDESKQTPVNMIGALLKQVISSDPVSFDIILQNLQKARKEGHNIKLDEACQLLTEALRKFDMVYLCLDALDECQEHRTPFLRSLNDLCEDSGLSRCLRIFLTGRAQVEQYVNTHITGPFLFRMTLDANKDDILKYIKYQIEHDDSGIVMGTDFTNEIVETIISTADGMSVNLSLYLP
jgi:type II secretory pathway predicted ATPase ExeA